MVPSEPPSVSVCPRGSPEPGGDPLRTVVWVRGEHDMATTAHVSSAIDAATRLDAADVVVDLSGILFMDASTIRVIVDAHNRLRASSRSLTVRAPSRVARRLLDLCELVFLVDGRPAPTRPPRAAALDSWVAVPSSGRMVDSAPPPILHEERAEDPAQTTSQLGGQPLGSLPPRRTP